MKRERLAVFLAAGATVGAATVSCRAPSVLFADAGELLAAVALKGVAHPPGFPLYLLFGGWFLRLTGTHPMTAASRLTLFSALCGAVAAGLLAVASHAALARLKLALRPTTTRVLAVAAGILGGFGPTLFDFSLDIEVYAIHAVFLCGALAAATVAGGADDPRVRRNASLLAGLAAGGGLAVHHATMAVILPGIALLLWGREERAARLRRAGLFAAALLPGLASYALLPLRAAGHPVLNWGDPKTPMRFWEHITAAIYQVNLETSASTIAAHFGRFVEAYREELTLFGIAAALAAVVVTLGRDRLAALGFLAVIAGDVAFAVRYEIAEDQAAYYIPTFLATSLLALVGAAFLLELLARKRSWLEGPGTAAAVVAVLALSASHLRGEAGRRHDLRAYEAAWNLLEAAPPGSLAFTPEWNLYSPAFAIQEVQRRRQDVLLVDILLLRRGWYLDTLARRWPERVAEVEPAFRAYRTKLADWEEHRPYDGNELTRLYDGLTQALAQAAWKRGAAVSWIGTVITEHLPAGAALVPTGIAYRVLPSRADSAVFVNDAPFDLAFARRTDLPEDPVFEEKMRPLEAGMLVQRALYELAFKRRAPADERIAAARALAPSNPEAIEVAADLLAADGKGAEALALYAEAISKGGDAARIAEKSRELQERAGASKR